MAEEFVRGFDEGALLTLRVSPGAKKSSVEGAYGRHALKLKIAAPPPVDGKANAENEWFLAKVFGLSRSQVSMIKGLSSRDKVALLKGVKSGEAARTLKGWIG